jgi:hypothetical protein
VCKFGRCQAAICIDEKYQELVEICKKMLMLKGNQLDGGLVSAGVD